jgi:hypothetical protein
MSDDSQKSSRIASAAATLPGVVSIKEVMQRKSESLIIPAEKTVDIGPDQKDYAKFFSVVQIRSFQDLQDLGLIPAELSEEKAKQAITRDGNEAFAIAQTRLRQGSSPKPCSCHGEEGKQGEERPAYRDQIRGVYNEVRKAHHPNFAQVLSEVYRAEVAFDDPIVAHVHAFISGLYAGRFTVTKVPVLKIADITIQKNATMNVGSTTKLLFANDIRIYSGGKMKLNSSFTKIKCSSIQGNLS